MGAQESSVIYQSEVPASDLEPNPWNPNVMDAQMFAKELESIKEFGFVDPLTVRPHPAMRKTGLGPMFQIIDGENRWKAGLELGMVSFPCIIVEVGDEEARQLTVVLNETRGTADQGKLAALVRDLAQKRDLGQIARVLPYPMERMRAMIGEDQAKIDWDALRDRRDKLKKDRDRWVERVYRIPVDAAKVIDEAIDKIKSQEGLEHEWQALEMIAADVLASG